MAPVKVFGMAMSANVARVLVCLDFGASEHKNLEHLARNPFGQIPAFQDGDLVLFGEFQAHIRISLIKHVLRKYKTSEVDLLREGNLQEAAAVHFWLDVEAHQYKPAVSPVVYQHLLVPMRGGTPDEKIIAVCIENTKKLLDVYEARLSKYKYLAGDFISLADLGHFPITYYFMTRTPYASVFDSYPSVKARWEDLMSRPAVQRVISQLPKSADDQK